MQPLRIQVYSWADSATICTLMERTLGRRPSIASLRMLIKVLILMESNGSKDGFKTNAYQIMNIVEARGQQDNESATASTFETVHKIYSGMQGRVSPMELNVILRSMGPRATGLSDDGLINIAALLSVPSPLTKPDPQVLIKADPASARQLAGKGVKGTVE